MGTYADIQNRIADELGGRADLLSNSAGMTASPIQLAILDAIRFWQDDRFFFNEYRTAAAFSTVKGQEFYTSSDWADIATIAEIDKLSVVISGNRYFMEPRTAEYMEDISLNPSVTGQPMDYAYYNEQLRFYPIPDGAYPINVMGTKAFSLPSNPNDTNVWTNDAEPLIRSEAKFRLFRDSLQDPNSGAIQQQAAKTEFANLKAQTFKRAAARKFRPTYF